MTGKAQKVDCIGQSAEVFFCHGCPRLDPMFIEPWGYMTGRGRFIEDGDTRKADLLPSN
jgi:hypothetical protein